MLTDGKLYGTIYAGENILPDESQDVEDMPSLESILEELPGAEDYESFKQEMIDAGMQLTNVEAPGEVGIKIEGEGVSIKLISKENGGLKMIYNVTIPAFGTISTSIGLVVEIDVVDEIEEEYIPSDLTGYDDAGDLEAWIEELMSGM